LKKANDFRRLVGGNSTTNSESDFHQAASL
jgi:hypothetical protein